MVADAVLSTLRYVWPLVENLRLPAAVMGGIALAAWKHVRATRDVDLMVGLGETDAQSVINELTATKLRPKRPDPIVTLGELRIAQFFYEPPDTYLDLQVDVLFAESDYQREAISRRIPTKLPDVNIDLFVLSCEDLVLHKLLAGRIIDRADVAALLRANSNAIDSAYLMDWADNLGVAHELEDIWNEALPGNASR